MPKLIGMSGMDAISLLENMGLEVGFTGIGESSGAVGKKRK